MPTQAQSSEIKGSIGSRKADDIYRQYLEGSTSVPRPGFNATGREVNLVLNAYPITGFPTQNVHQYDVSYHTLSFGNSFRKKIQGLTERFLGDHPENQQRT
jgi:eukaryotic translation initiation factor 2C